MIGLDEARREQAMRTGWWLNLFPENPNTENFNLKAVAAILLTPNVLLQSPKPLLLAAIFNNLVGPAHKIHVLGRGFEQIARFVSQLEVSWGVACHINHIRLPKLGCSVLEVQGNLA